MLVLLIIFMVAAPLSTVDLPIDSDFERNAQKKPDKPTYVSIKPDLRLRSGRRCQARRSGRPLDAWRMPTRTSFIFLRADRAVPMAT